MQVVVYSKNATLWWLKCGVAHSSKSEGSLYEVMTLASIDWRRQQSAAGAFAGNKLLAIVTSVKESSSYGFATWVYICLILSSLSLSSPPLPPLFTCSALWEVQSCHCRLASRVVGWSDGWRQSTEEHRGLARLCRGSASPLGGPLCWSAVEIRGGEGGEGKGWRAISMSAVYIHVIVMCANVCSV